MLLQSWIISLISISSIVRAVHLSAIDNKYLTFQSHLKWSCWILWSRFYLKPISVRKKALFVELNPIRNYLSSHFYTHSLFFLKDSLYLVLRTIYLRTTFQNSYDILNKRKSIQIYSLFFARHFQNITCFFSIENIHIFACRKANMYLTFK